MDRIRNIFSGGAPKITPEQYKKAFHFEGGKVGTPAGPRAVPETNPNEDQPLEVITLKNAAVAANPTLRHYDSALNLWANRCGDLDKKNAKEYKKIANSILTQAKDQEQPMTINIESNKALTQFTIPPMPYNVNLNVRLPETNLQMVDASEHRHMSNFTIAAKTLGELKAIPCEELHVSSSGTVNIEVAPDTTHLYLNSPEPASISGDTKNLQLIEHKGLKKPVDESNPEAKPEPADAETIGKVTDSYQKFLIENKKCTLVINSEHKNGPPKAYRDQERELKKLERKLEELRNLVSNNKIDGFAYKLNEKSENLKETKDDITKKIDDFDPKIQENTEEIAKEIAKDNKKISEYKSDLDIIEANIKKAIYDKMKAPQAEDEANDDLNDDFEDSTTSNNP